MNHETTLDELIEQLEGIRECGVDGETPMRILIQPNYPLQLTLGNLGVLPSERKLVQQREALNECAVRNNIPVTEMDGPEDQPPYADEVKVIYLTTGEHPYDDSPYGPSFGILQDPGEIEEDPDLERDDADVNISCDQGHYVEDDHLSRAEREDRRYEMKFGADAGAD